MNDLEELKSLLFGAEKEVLDSITERVQKPETRAADVADILPEAVRLSHRGGSDLVATLREPVVECMQQSFRAEPQQYADALYPVIGPAIRKAIMNALRSFAQQINETVEHSLTAKGLKWRFEAWRAGVPFGDYVVQRSLLYRVEQAYLISRENGLLVGHVHHDASRIKDSEAVSGMFTAIQDFIKESFSADRSGRLETADMGEFTLWAVHGPHALLVCVIRGVPPRSLRADLSAILERIHFRYGDSVHAYAGDTTTVPGVEEELAECLGLEARKAAATDKRRLWVPLIVVSLLIAAAFTYFAYKNWQESQQERALANAIDSASGLYVAAIERDGGVFTLRGLRDPLAPSVDELAASAGLAPARVVADLRPYQSLDAEIVFLRARNAIAAPESVSVTASDGSMILTGTAPQAWINAVQRKAAAGILGLVINLDGLSPANDAQPQAQPRPRSQPRPESQPTPEPQSPPEPQSREALQTEIDKAAVAQFFFTARANLRGDDTVRMRQHAAIVAQLVENAAKLGMRLRIQVIGYTDGTGSAAANSQLAESRADVAVQTLLLQGIDAALISRANSVTSAGIGSPNPELRRVSIGLLREPPTASDPPASE